MPKPPPPESPLWTLFNAAGKLNVLLLRATGGRVGGGFGKARILVLHLVGRKSGARRETPVLYLADGDSYVVVASKGGVDKHPAWFHNLMAMDALEVEVPRVGRRRVRPRVAAAEERERLWPRLVEMYKPYADYASYTPREIPVVVLDPV